MTKHRISSRGLALIKSFESFVPYVYDDLVAPVGGKYREWKGGAVHGTLTIGYGHTNAAKHPLKTTLGLRISEREACEILDADLDECEAAVNSLVKVEITQGQFDSLVSFAYNCGVGNLKKLIEPLNRGDYAKTRARFDLYVRSKGKVLRGLQRRRDAEQALWDNEDPNLPVETVHAPPHVDGQKTVSEVVKTSRSVRQIANAALAAVAASLASGLDWISGVVTTIVHALPFVAEDVSAKTGAARTIAEQGGLSLPAKVMLGFTVLCALGALYQVVQDKRNTP